MNTVKRTSHWGKRTQISFFDEGNVFIDLKRVTLNGVTKEEWNSIEVGDMVCLHISGSEKPEIIVNKIIKKEELAAMVA